MYSCPFEPFPFPLTGTGRPEIGESGATRERQGREILSLRPDQVP